MDVARIGDFTLQWGESVRWDDRAGRLYFVDCGTHTLHWLEDAQPPLHSQPVPGLPTGLVLAEDGRLVVCLDDGLHVVDVERETTELLSPYPDGLGGRANDANADLDGNLVTGTLNLAPGPGSYWSYSASQGWRKLADGAGNVNGPVVVGRDREQTLIAADTHSSALNAFPYDGTAATLGERRVFADTTELGGTPDGACADEAGAIWSCILAGGKIARFTDAGFGSVIDTGIEQPSDVTFGGRDLDRMFFTSIALAITGREITSPDAGGLMVVDGTGVRGRPEPRFRL